MERSGAGNAVTASYFNAFASLASGGAKAFGQSDSSSYTPDAGGNEIDGGSTGAIE